MERDAFDRHYATLARDIHVDGGLLREVFLWALLEKRIEALTPPRRSLGEMIRSRDGFSRYRDFVEQATGRVWEYECLKVHWDRARKSATSHVRQPVALEARLRLFFTSPGRCRHCGREPPDVKLHIDHKEPVAKGGTSDIGNLQYLCEECNLTKGPKLKREDFFDRYLC